MAKNSKKCGKAELRKSKAVRTIAEDLGMSEICCTTGAKNILQQRKTTIAKMEGSKNAPLENAELRWSATCKKSSAYFAKLQK